MKHKRFLTILFSLVLMIFGAIGGLIIGMYLGGNYFVNFEFANVRGYEAVGLVGAIIGFSFGLIIAIMIVCYAHRKNR